MVIYFKFLNSNPSVGVEGLAAVKPECQGEQAQAFQPLHSQSVCTGTWTRPGSAPLRTCRSEFCVYLFGMLRSIMVVTSGSTEHEKPWQEPHACHSGLLNACFFIEIKGSSGSGANIKHPK